MSKVPEDVKEMIKNLADNTTKGEEFLQKEVQKVMKENPTVNAIESFDSRIRLATRIIISKYYKKKGIAKEFLIRVIAKKKVRTVGVENKKVADVFAICKEIADEEKEPKYRSITLWEEASECVDELEINEVYETNLIEGDELYSNATAFFKSDKEMIEAEEFFQSQPSVIIDEITETKKPVIILANIKSARNVVSKVGHKDYYIYEIYGNDMDKETTVFVDKELFLYNDGSTCLFVSDIWKNDENELQLNVHKVVPAGENSTIPIEKKAKPVSQEQPTAPESDKNEESEKEEQSEEQTDDDADW